MNLFKKIIKTVAPNFVISYHIYKQFVANKQSYLHKTGWIKGLELKYPCDAEGNELPWMNFSVVSFLQQRLNKDLKLFEYGSGYSTAFFSKLVKDVTSVEYNLEWFELVKSKSPNNVKLVHLVADKDGEYCRAIKNSQELFDVVVVDGRDRVNCMKQSLPCLTENGVIILDDSNRGKYKEGKEFLLKEGFKKLEFEGLKPGGYGELVQTTVFYRKNNVLGL